jgi:hypothetical protein
MVPSKTTRNISQPKDNPPAEDAPRDRPLASADPDGESRPRPNINYSPPAADRSKHRQLMGTLLANTGTDTAPGHEEATIWNDDNKGAAASPQQQCPIVDDTSKAIHDTGHPRRRFSFEGGDDTLDVAHVRENKPRRIRWPEDSYLPESDPAHQEHLLISNLKSSPSLDSPGSADSVTGLAHTDQSSTETPETDKRGVDVTAPGLPISSRASLSSIATVIRVPPEGSLGSHTPKPMTAADNVASSSAPDPETRPT